MTDERRDGRSTGDDDEHKLKRSDAARVAVWNARKRIIGSYALGGLAVWKLIKLPERPPEFAGIDWTLVMWLGLALLAFGIANIDQFLKALGRGGSS